MIINHAEFLTESPLNLLPFYRDVLQVPIMETDEDVLTVQVGYTRITFQRTTEQVEQLPYYHFAFNIPENKFDEAKKWLESKIELSKEDGSDISRSELWDSHSVYFFDPAGNILELIARHTMDNAVERPFIPETDLLGVSEIGLPTKNVSRAVDQLEALGIFTYKDRSDIFNPSGDEEGMFIVVKPGRRWHFTDKTAEYFPFKVTVQGIGDMSLDEDEAGLQLRIK